MLSLIRPALSLFLLFTLLTGIAYPLAITGIAQLVFPSQANGSIIERNGKLVGSSLIGQEFSDPKYFWGRPSATGPVPYTSFNSDKLTGSSGSNLAPTNPALVDKVKSRIEALNAADKTVDYDRSSSTKSELRSPNSRIPIDLVTSSASGLDPHISPAAADYQVPRIAKARNLSVSAVRDLIRAHTNRRQLGFLGEPVVNVLELNLALDAHGR